MPRLKNILPAYRLHKPSGRAVVTLAGTDHYLGTWNSPQSRVEYDRLIAEWLTAGRSTAKAAESPPTAPTVEQVILKFWRHAEKHYRAADGAVTQELANLKEALKPLRRLYGHTPAHAFGPLGLRAVRDQMIRSGRLARGTINARINRIRRVFRWAVSVELIPASVDHGLRTVEGLKLGRTEAAEAPPVEPVELEVVEATLPHLPRPVAAMVRLQLLTGCRAGEVMAMRGCDLTPGEPTWEYRPGSHKNAWRGKKRVIPLGPKAVEIVREFLRAETSAYLFDPREVSCPHFVGRTNARYDRRSYRQAVCRACDKAFPHPAVVELQAAVKAAPLGGRRRAMAELRAWKEEHAAELARWRDAHRWSPLQLRHTSATMIRAKYGLEATSNVLGHAKADVTQIYAERDLARAKTIANEIG